ncbi:hypothetical protein SARC_06653 [Sphaeroforma arctica JP610]|uniref:Exonuclease domain-containing protein n=1 Tax=Sphaeroforma arctica JP610 TaxID=667725 RepID=A0A0L0FVZ5_9EUKA|nr:hypothetical protein SARC_06653 [Sphaeroforma arctica JP610]KNC81007.1 hypothetical protein SARC_06653 [Sphaeroforma arctica JP610]|eukprot:XP_014154909.1 hypothetical protein SARC_06653 [Sphaeroforma arctica JP610]
MYLPQDKADVLERLVTTHGFNINVQKSMDKMTPAHLSVWLRKHHLTDLLRKLGADCDNVINKYGESVDGLIAMHKRKDNLVWMDLEFTSLTDPEILEVAVIITDGTMEKELARQRWVIHASEAKINSLEDWHQRHFCDVQDGGNGLFSECLASEMSVEECEQELLVLLSQHCEERQNCLAGSSVHCDRQVLNTQMPAVYKFLSHQIIDVSTFIGAARRWRPALSDPREYQRNKAKKARRMAENLSKSVVNDSKSAEDDSKSAESDSKLAENGTNEAEKELKSSTDAEDGVVDDSIAAKKGVASDVSGAASEYDGHRAMADIERSIEVGRWARDVFFNPVDSS